MGVTHTTASAAIYKIPFLVGVTGHRDLVPEEIPAIREALTKLFDQLRATARDVEIKLLSSMADGADLLAADVAHEAGIGIIALLPFSAERCRAELTTDAARLVFDRTMQNAELLEVPRPGSTGDASSESDRDHQFQRAGVLVARYSSLLIAVWNGAQTDLAAGTARVVECRRRGLPASDEERRGGPGSLLGAADNDLIYEIRCSRLSDARTEPPGISNLGFVSSGERIEVDRSGLPPGLRALLERTAGFNRDVAEYSPAIVRQGRRLAPPAPFKTPGSLLYMDHLFVAADWLGVHFRHCYTRALRARYALWALLALLLLVYKKGSTEAFALPTILGVLAIFAIGAGLARWAYRRNWQRRYLDYRALAEGLRVSFYWELAGVRKRFGDEFAHESFLQKQDIDLEWIRAAMRAVSLRCALLPPVDWPGGFAHAFAGWIGDAHPVSGSGQLHYYRQRSHALERRQKWAEELASGSLYAGLGVAIILAVDAYARQTGSPWLTEPWHDVLLWPLALLTIYGAIFEIYLGEKADRALIRQYRYMHSLFSFAAAELSAAHSEANKLELLRALGHACLAEHAQWILAHRDKRIEGMRW
jgi:hypothetical protein